VLALLRAHRGLGAAEVARALGIDRTTARYHLRRLERQGLGVEHSARWFAAGTLPPRERARHMRDAVSPEVLAAVRAAPGLPKTELARHVGLARPTLAWHLARLSREGLVRSERDGRAARVYPTRETT
jgi:predicted transcriptional regulator